MTLDEIGDVLQSSLPRLPTTLSARYSVVLLCTRKIGRAARLQPLPLQHRRWNNGGAETEQKYVPNEVSTQNSTHMPKQDASTHSTLHPRLSRTTNNPPLARAPRALSLTHGLGRLTHPADGLLVPLIERCFCSDLRCMKGVSRQQGLLRLGRHQPLER